MTEPTRPAVRDVMDALRETERRLRESEARLRLALWAAEMICWEWDVSVGRVHVTGSLGTLTDRGDQPRSHLAPSQLADVYEEDRAAVAAADRRSVEEGAEYAVEFRVRAGDGSLRWLAQQGRVVETDDAGRAGRVAGVVMDVTDRRRLQENMAHRASHDPLTDLPNRALFLERLGAALDRHRGNGRSPAVLFLDLDGFKAVNDRHGHDAGDRVLVAVAERLRATVPPGATIARLGGDEFTVLLDDADGADAAAVAELIAAAMRRPIVLDGRELRLAASIGVAPGWDGRAGPRALLRAADAALYRAKAVAAGGTSPGTPPTLGVT